EARDRTARVRVAVGLVGARDAGIGRAGGADGARDRLGRAVALAAVALVRVGVVALLARVLVAVAAPVERAGRRARVAEHAVLRAGVAPLARSDDVAGAELELAGGRAAVVRVGVAVVALLVAGNLPVATLEQAESGAAVAVFLVGVVALLAGIEAAVATVRGGHQLAGGAAGCRSGRSVVALLSRV